MKLFTPEQQEIDRLKGLLRSAGICPVCESEIVHNMDEPLTNCKCAGQSEWTSAPPLLSQRSHKIRLLGQALGELLESVGVLRPGVSLTGPELLLVAKEVTATMKKAGNNSA